MHQESIPTWCTMGKAANEEQLKCKQFVQIVLARPTLLLLLIQDCPKKWCWALKPQLLTWSACFLDSETSAQSIFQFLLSGLVFLKVLLTLGTDWYPSTKQRHVTKSLCGQKDSSSLQNTQEPSTGEGKADREAGLYHYTRGSNPFHLQALGYQSSK